MSNVPDRRAILFGALKEMIATFTSYSEENFDDVMSSALRPIAEAANIARVAVYRLLDGAAQLGQIYNWYGETIPIDEEMRVVPELPPILRWLEVLTKGDYINADVSKMPEDEAAFLSLSGVKSICFVPIFTRGELWGIVTLGNNTDYGFFDEDCLDLLQSAAQLCAGAVMRNEAEHEQNRLKAETELALIQAQEASREKSEFLSRMSHEMLTPMNAIIGMLQLAKITGDPQKREKRLGEIDKASRQLLHLINDTLDVSRVGYGTFKLVDSVFDFNAMIRDILHMTGFNAVEKRQSFTSDISPAIPASLIGDERRLKQAIVNLSANAIKFTPENGKIHFSACVLETDNEKNISLQFEISDTGIGISKEKQNDIFNFFEQADGGTTREHGGIGLGLSLSKRIVEMMGGDICIESEPGKGSTFTVTCKLKRELAQNRQVHDSSNDSFAQDALMANISAQTNGTHALDTDFCGKCILVVDDMAVNRTIIKNLLRKTCPQIIEAENGKEAVCLFLEESENIDLIIMDIMMPEMDGYEATRKIRASGLPNACDIPIIALTANVSNESVRAAKDAGMNLHLTKPIEAPLIMAALKHYLI